MIRFARRQTNWFVITGALLLFTPRPSLATLYWDADGTAAANNTATGAGLGGIGNWDAAGKWFDGVSSDVSWTSATDALFTGSSGTVTLNSPQSATSLAFKSNGYTITGSTLTLGPTPANITTDPGVTATIASTIAGSATMTKLGPGTLVLGNNANINTADTTSGGWRIEGGGILNISADTALGAPLPDSARNTVTDITFNQSTIQFGADMVLSQNRRTKVNTNSSTQNLGDAIIDVNQHVVSWFGSIQGGLGSLRVTDANNNGGMLILGTDKIASINPFGSALPAGTVNLTVEGHVVVQTAGTVTPTGGELGSETGAGGGRLAILLQAGGQIRSESGGYTFQRNLILGPGGGSLDTGAWIQHFDGGTISGPGSLTKFGGSTLIIDNPSATWAGGTFIRSGTLQLGAGGSNGLLPGTLATPSSLVIDSGATLKFDRGSDKSFFDVISGDGNVTISNANNATVRLVSDNTYTGLTTINSGILMIGQGNPGNPGSIVSDVLNNATLDFNRVEDLTYAGSISGTGSVTKEAAGKLTLTGASSYGGGTNVVAGTLVAANTSGSATGTGPVTVAAGASLAGNGTIAGAVSISAGAHLAPGTSPGNLTVDSLSLDSGSVLDYELGAAGTRDLTTITSTGGLTLNGATLNITALSGFAAGEYPILDYTGTFTGTPASLTIGTAPAGYSYSFVNNQANTSIDLVVVPEPASIVLVLCLAGFYWCGRPRLNSKTIASAARLATLLGSGRAIR
ncbi:MAG TPA: autotransporter-associated beta strand repeat-containing protein [Lacipirellulaceae bacterium]|nr:autotransporter-associated beta strand repeat-containing protein [Lacipirellulaceae bacterium]